MAPKCTGSMRSRYLGGDLSTRRLAGTGLVHLVCLGEPTLSSPRLGRLSQLKRSGRDSGHFHAYQTMSTRRIVSAALKK